MKTLCVFLCNRPPPNLRGRKPLFTAHDPVGLQLEPVQLGQLASAPWGVCWTHLWAGAPSRSGPRITHPPQAGQASLPWWLGSIGSKRKQISMVLPSISPGEAGEMARA